VSFVHYRPPNPPGSPNPPGKKLRPWYWQTNNAIREVYEYVR
jgi:hypothetical protein